MKEFFKKRRQVRIIRRKRNQDSEVVIYFLIVPNAFRGERFYKLKECDLLKDCEEARKNIKADDDKDFLSRLPRLNKFLTYSELIYLIGCMLRTTYYQIATIDDFFNYVESDKDFYYKKIEEYFKEYPYVIEDRTITVSRDGIRYLRTLLSPCSFEIKDFYD